MGSKMRLAGLGLILIALFVWQKDRFGSSDTQRIEIWKTALNASRDNLLIGLGPDGFSTYFMTHKPVNFNVNRAANAHNDLLQASATLGVAGLIVYLIFAVGAFKGLTGPALGSIVALFICAKFNPIPLEAMIIGAVVLGAAHHRNSFQVNKPVIVMMAIFMPIVGMIAYADYRRGLGDIEGATRANPYEVSYKKSALLAGGGIEHVKSAVKNRPFSGETIELLGAIK